jgi:hypothetical protein
MESAMRRSLRGYERTAASGPLQGRLRPPLQLDFFTPSQRFAVAGPFFFIFGLCDPRGSVRLALGGRFARAARLSFLRSALSVMFRVFMTFLLSIVGANFVMDDYNDYPLILNKMLGS